MKKAVILICLAVGLVSVLVDWSWLVGLVGRQSLLSIYMKGENLGLYVNLYLKSIVLVLAAAVAGGSFIKEPQLRRSVFWWVVTGSVFYTVVMGLMSYQRYLAFHSYHDMTANLEALTNIFRTGLPLSTAEGSLYELPVMNWFGIHFTPIIYIFALLILPFPMPAGIFVVQALLLGSGALAVYLLAKDVLKEEFPALIFAAAYLLYPTLQYTNLYEFEFFRFVTPLLLWAFLFINRRQLWWSLFFLLLALMTREDTAPVILVLGAYLFFIRKERGLGGLVGLTAVVYGLAAQLWLRPYFCGAGTDFVIKNVYAAYGQTPLQVLVYFATHPLIVLFLIFSPLKMMNVLLLLLPLGLFSLASPWLLLVAFAGMLIPLLAPGIAQANIFLHKFAAAIPFLFIAAIYGYRNLKSYFTGFSLAWFLLICAVLSSLFFGPAPWSLQFWLSGYRLADFRTHSFHYSYYQSGEHEKLARQALALIPASAVVSAEHFFLPHLFNRKKLYTYPVVGRDVEYVLIDRRHPNKRPEFNPGSKSSRLAFEFTADPGRFFERLARDRGFVRIYDRDGIELFRREER